MGCSAPIRWLLWGEWRRALEPMRGSMSVWYAHSAQAGIAIKLMAAIVRV